MTTERPEFLIEAAELAARLGEPGLRVLDVTAKLDRTLVNQADELIADAHVPGSVAFDVPSGMGVLSDPDAALPWTWPGPDRITASLRAAGIDDGDEVVLVARTPRDGIDAGTMWCTRAWWTLHHSGVHVRILRGGIERWQAEGHPLTGEPTVITPGSATAVDGRDGPCASKDDVLAALADGATCVVDALPASSYDGTDGGYGPRRGHITGAVNLPFRGLVDAETAGFPDLDELRSRLDAGGLLDQERVLSYCGGAIAATVPAFALALLGRDDVSVYDGSLMEWAADESLPMTT
ncbi:MAG: rhodanese-like domain-containing protein [Actinomycetota bacterium]